MSGSEIVPPWVDQEVAELLPGGDRWEGDRAAGHPALAAHFKRSAVGSFDYDRSLLRVGGGHGFDAVVEVHRAAPRPSTFRLRDLRAFGRGRSFTLPIAYPRSFETLLIELTRSLDDFSRREFDGGASAPALLRPVLPGGWRWERDQQAGHAALAARTHRLATGSLDPGTIWINKERLYESDRLPMAGGFSLIVGRWKRGNQLVHRWQKTGHGSVGEDFHGVDVWFCRLRPDDKPLVLPRALPISRPHDSHFWAMVQELNRAPR